VQQQPCGHRDIRFGTDRVSTCILDQRLLRPSAGGPGLPEGAGELAELVDGMAKAGASSPHTRSQQLALISCWALRASGRRHLHFQQRTSARFGPGRAHAWRSGASTHPSGAPGARETGPAVSPCRPAACACADRTWGLLPRTRVGAARAHSGVCWLCFSYPPPLPPPLPLCTPPLAAAGSSSPAGRQPSSPLVHTHTRTHARTQPD
jgi:hypothetical protein